MSTMEQRLAEEATGCVEHPSGLKFYARGGLALSPDEAAQRLSRGKLVEVPAAGAGSYNRVLEQLFGDRATNVQVIDWTSSAGDWVFGFELDSVPVVLFQENRYPYHGFKYRIGPAQGFE